MVGTEVYWTAFSGILSSGGLLCSDWLPPNYVIAHYHKVDLSVFTRIFTKMGILRSFVWICVFKCINT